jgi:hypothetical protein
MKKVYNVNKITHFNNSETRDNPFKHQPIITNGKNSCYNPSRTDPLNVRADYTSVSISKDGRIREACVYITKPEGSTPLTSKPITGHNPELVKCS